MSKLNWTRFAALLCAAVWSFTLTSCGDRDITGHESGSIVSGQSSEPIGTQTPNIPSCDVNDTVIDVGLCVTDSAHAGDTPEQIAKRFGLYKDLGIRTIRIAILWGEFEPAEGTFRNIGALKYFVAAKEAGLRIKLILGAVSVIPQWYLRQYPNAMLVNDAGKKAVSSITYLMPGLRERIDKAVDDMLRYLNDTGMLDIVDSIVVDMGPAGEPLYPPAWTQTPNGLYEPSGPEHFWMYDRYMQADFKKVMEEKYGTIEAANEAWGQSYDSFGSLAVPKPGTVRGVMWNDVLTWYRDVKRDFIEENIQSYKRAVEQYGNGRIKLILYIPGSDVRDKDWDSAVKSGEGSDMVKLMADSRFIMDKAKEYGCWLQYTGAENEREVKYLTEYMFANHMENIPLFGENAGGYDVGRYMGGYVRKLKRYGLAGIDITHSIWIHAADGYSPNEFYDSIKENLHELAAYLEAARQ